MGKAKVTSYKRARLGAMLNPDYAASLITGIQMRLPCSFACPERYPGITQ